MKNAVTGVEGRITALEATVDGKISALEDGAAPRGQIEVPVVQESILDALGDRCTAT